MMYTMPDSSRFGGNQGHLSPELVDANTLLSSEYCSSVTVDVSKHMVFACGVAMVELIRLPHKSPLPGYPSSYQDRTTHRVAFDERHMVDLPAYDDLRAAG
jgi:hypothetical protein